MTIGNEQIQALKALYANIEKQAHALRGSPREYSVITGLCPVNVIEMQAQKIQALLAESEADKALIAELQRKLIHREFLLESADQVQKEYAEALGCAGDNESIMQAIDGLHDQVRTVDMSNGVLNSRIAELEARTLTVKHEPWRSFVTDDDIAALNRFAECCDDPESGGHDLDKDQVTRLEKIGALQRSGRVSYITDFGDFILSAAAGITLVVGGE